MYGIGGVFGRDGTVDGATHSAVNDCQAHRGPDDAGILLDGLVGLAHRRLSIIDPEGGTQPLFNKDGSIAVVFNDEIYNHYAI